MIAAMALHVLIAFQMERTVAGTDIDTYTFQREGCARLLHGINPYGGTQANIYSSTDSARYYGPGVVKDGRVQVGMQYPPLTLLWGLPGYLLGDIRYSYVLAIVLSAWLLFALSPGPAGFGLSLILLLNPLTFSIENRCFTEPMVLLLLCATVFAALKRRAWLFLALGLFLSSKQYNFLALPLMGFLIQPFRWRECLKTCGGAVAVAVATVIPFALWNWGALVHDLVRFHLAQPFRMDSISFAVLFPALLKLGPVLCLGLLVWIVCRSPRLVGVFAAGYGLALLLFVATSKQAFANYYFLVGNALMLGVAALLKRGGILLPSEVKSAH